MRYLAALGLRLTDRSNRSHEQTNPNPTWTQHEPRARVVNAVGASGVLYTFDD